LNKLIITTIVIFTAHFALYGQNVLFNTVTDIDSSAREQSFSGIS